MFICIRFPAARKKGVLRVQTSVVREGQEEGRPPAHQDRGTRVFASISPAVCAASFTLKRIQILINAPTWVNLQGILPGLKSQPEKVTHHRIPFKQHFSNDGILEKEGMLVASRGQVQGAERGAGAAEGAGETLGKLKPPSTFMPGHPSLDAWTPGRLMTVRTLGAAFILAPPASRGTTFKLPFPLRKVEAPKQMNFIVSGRISSMGSTSTGLLSRCHKIVLKFT